MDTRKILDLRAKSKITNAMPVEDRRTHPKTAAKGRHFPDYPDHPDYPETPDSKVFPPAVSLKIFDFPTFI